MDGTAFERFRIWLAGEYLKSRTDRSSVIESAGELGPTDAVRIPEREVIDWLTSRGIAQREAMAAAVTTGWISEISSTIVGPGLNECFKLILPKVLDKPENPKLGSVLKRAVVALESGLSVSDCLPMLRQVEPAIIKTFGPRTWPGCEFRFNERSQDWTLITSIPGLDFHHDAELPIDFRSLIADEQSELKKHLLKVLKNWIAFADDPDNLNGVERPAEENQPCPLRAGYVGDAPTEVANAVRRAIPKWDGRNWVAVRHCIELTGQFSKGLDFWTMDDIRQRFALGHKIMLENLRGTPDTTDATIGPIEVATVRVESVETNRTGRGGRKRTKTNAQERQILNAWESGGYKTHNDLDEFLELDWGTVKATLDRLNARKRRAEQSTKRTK